MLQTPVRNAIPIDRYIVHAPDSLPALREALHDGAPEVRKSARIAIAQIEQIEPSGERQLLAAEQLRRMCPCAECRRRRWLSQSIESPAHIELEQLQPMGYGVQIGFSDGYARLVMDIHSAGSLLYDRAHALPLRLFVIQPPVHA